MTAFRRDAAERWSLDLPDYAALHRFSVERATDFWRTVWDFTDIRGDIGERIVERPDAMPGARYFPDARLNYTENLLRGDDSQPAIVFNGENRVRRSLTMGELRAEVSAFAHALVRMGVHPGDRVAAYLPNMPEAVVGVLGAAAIGAIWSSCSPDFGVQGVLDRFGQIEPVVLLAVDGYVYGGKIHDCTSRLAEIVSALPTLRRVVVAPYVTDAPDISRIPHAVRWDEFVDGAPSQSVAFEPFPFNHPLYIVYSSGTTGVPKCIVHGAGGTLIQHLKEHQFHCDIKAGDRVFYFTTCGWMMWNWLVSVLASGATMLLYDGSAFHADGNVLFDFADETGMTLFGTSAKFIDASAKAGLAPIETHVLETVRTMTSTGSPLAPESFDYVYKRIKRDIHLASISGGTDIISCFVGGNPAAPVWRGEIQCAGLGLAVEVFDEYGHPVRERKGELVCTTPFPSMPIGFWNDPDDRRYRAAYFERYPGVWHHGDYMEQTAHDGFIIYGRSDAVLNPGGVRIGTAEIYRQVEQLPRDRRKPRHWSALGERRAMVLFVRLRDGHHARRRAGGSYTPPRP